MFFHEQDFKFSEMVCRLRLLIILKRMHISIANSKINQSWRALSLQIWSTFCVLQPILGYNGVAFRPELIFNIIICSTNERNLVQNEPFYSKTLLQRTLYKKKVDINDNLWFLYASCFLKGIVLPILILHSLRAHILNNSLLFTEIKTDKYFSR